ncbi:MAG: hypothetical protein RBR42_00700 [Desulfomicrobium sp.]|nr:hypothetical protein [Desulfomicrobium sp.]
MKDYQFSILNYQLSICRYRQENWHPRQLYCLSGFFFLARRAFFPLRLKGMHPLALFLLLYVPHT